MAQKEKERHSSHHSFTAIYDGKRIKRMKRKGASVGRKPQTISFGGAKGTDSNTDVSGEDFPFTDHSRWVQKKAFKILSI